MEAEVCPEDEGGEEDGGGVFPVFLGPDNLYAGQGHERGAE